MSYTVSCHPESTGESASSALDDADLEVDVDAPRARVALTGSLGPRSASALRAVLEALDGVTGPVDVVCRNVAEATPGVATVLVEAEARRRELGFADIRIGDPTGAVGSYLPHCERCGAALVSRAHNCRG